MLDKEVKDILQEQFSKERNYQKVLYSVNKKSISYNKIFKLALHCFLHVLLYLLQL